jgi:hypothetical protein
MFKRPEATPERRPPRSKAGGRRSFGPSKVFREEQELNESVWKHQKVRYLLAYLAKHWRAPVSEQQLLEDVKNL